MTKHKIGTIGGTGLCNIEGFTNQKWVKIKTPFGAPSDDFLTGKLAGRDVIFLARHRRGHRILPSELNHRANIWAMKKLGAQWIVSVCAAGGQKVFGIVQGGSNAALREECAKALVEMEFDGYAIGGVSVGEPEDEMLKAIELTEPFLPAHKARYAMGLGTFAEFYRDFIANYVPSKKVLDARKTASNER